MSLDAIHHRQRVALSATKWMLRTSTLAVSWVLAACAAATTQSNGGTDLGQRRVELERLHTAAAARAERGDFVGTVTDLIAPDGFYGAAMATLGAGPNAARAFLLRDSLNARSRALCTVVRLDVSADGNDGYSYGYFDVIRSNGDTLPGAFKAYWRRGADGRWKALAFGRSPRQLGPRRYAPDSLFRPGSYRSWPAPDTAQARQSLVDTETAFSDSSRGNIRAAFMSFAAPDAGKVSGAAYVFGPEALGEDYRNPPPRFAGMSWFAKWGTVAKSNDIGFNVGPVTLGAPPGESAPPGGMFFTIWKRQANGEWKYVVD